MSEQRYANVIAPLPSASEGVREHLTARVAAHHAARAWAFWQTAQNLDDPTHHDALSAFLPEYRLAMTWHLLNETDFPDTDAIAHEVISDLESPHVIGPNLHQMLSAYGIPPEFVKPYRPVSLEG